MKRVFILMTGVLAVVAVLFMNASDPAMRYEVGDTVADFNLPNVDGKNVSMGSYTNSKGFIIVFTCNTCPYAKAYESRIIDLDATYSAKGFPVIAINPNDVTRQPGDSMEEMKKRSSEKEYTFPYLRDDTQQVAKAFGATKTPHVYLIGKKGSEYRVEYIGAIDDSPRDASDVSQRYVEDAVDALLSGSKPSVTEKRAIGCSIKWKES